MTDFDNDKNVWQRVEPDSPCQNICLIDPDSKLCIGCYRTGDEIARWSAMGAEARRDITAVLPARIGLVKRGRKGGRRARVND